MTDIQKIAQYAIDRVAESQSFEKIAVHALWADFYDCLQEAAKSECGVDIPDLSQEMIEANKAN